jgi:hypothetical protein
MKLDHEIMYITGRLYKIDGALGKLFTYKRLGPYSETCSNLQHSKLRQKTVCPNLFTALPNYFVPFNFTIFGKHC